MAATLLNHPEAESIFFASLSNLDLSVLFPGSGAVVPHLRNCTSSGGGGGARRPGGGAGVPGGRRRGKGSGGWGRGRGRGAGVRIGAGGRE